MDEIFLWTQDVCLRYFIQMETRQSGLQPAFRHLTLSRISVKMSTYFGVTVRTEPYAIFASSYVCTHIFVYCACM